jgi:hypothetical protein
MSSFTNSTASPKQISKSSKAIHEPSLFVNFVSFCYYSSGLAPPRLWAFAFTRFSSAYSAYSAVHPPPFSMGQATHKTSFSNSQLSIFNSQLILTDAPAPPITPRQKIAPEKFRNPQSAIRNSSRSPRHRHRHRSDALDHRRQNLRRSRQLPQLPRPTPLQGTPRSQSRTLLRPPPPIPKTHPRPRQQRTRLPLQFHAPLARRPPSQEPPSPLRQTPKMFSTRPASSFDLSVFSLRRIRKPPTLSGTDQFRLQTPNAAQRHHRHRPANRRPRLRTLRPHRTRNQNRRRQFMNRPSSLTSFPSVQTTLPFLCASVSCAFAFNRFFFSVFSVFRGHLRSFSRPSRPSCLCVENSLSATSRDLISTLCSLPAILPMR